MYIELIKYLTYLISLITLSSSWYLKLHFGVSRVFDLEAVLFLEFLSVVNTIVLLSIIPVLIFLLIRQKITIKLLILVSVYLSSFYHFRHKVIVLSKTEFELFNSKMKPLVNAIDSFYIDSDKSLNSINDLVPDFIKYIPKPEIGNAEMKLIQFNDILNNDFRHSYLSIRLPHSSYEGMSLVYSPYIKAKIHSQNSNNVGCGRSIGDWWFIGESANFEEMIIRAKKSKSYYFDRIDCK